MKYRKSRLLRSTAVPFKHLILGGLVLSVPPLTLPVFAQDSDAEAATEGASLDEALGESADSDGGDSSAAPPESDGDPSAEIESASDQSMPEDEALKSMPTLDLEKSEEDPFAFEDEEGLDEFQKSSQELEDEFRKGAFQAALNKILPLRPDEIRTLLEHYDRTIESTELPVHPNPRAELVVQNVSLDPGSPPLIIKLAFGYVTTINMIDSSGAPWPFEDISWVGDFEVQGDTQRESTNVIRISPDGDFAHGNVSVRMVGLDTPLVFTLETNRDIVHYRFDAVLPGNGPYASAPLMQTGISLASGDLDMSAALSGVLPKDALKLSVSGADGRTSAFKYNNYTYVRTPLTLLSPAWESSVSSADGTKVYALADAPVLLLSDKGRMVRAYLSEREDLLDE